MDARQEDFDAQELRRHSEWLRNLARGLVGDDCTADDLAQDAWHALASRRRRRVRKLRPFLAGVVRNLASKRARSEARRVRRERATAKGELLPSSAELVERLEIQRIVVEELQAMGDPRRTTIFLHYFDGLSSSEIAQRQGVPAATVRSRLKRGLDHLRERLARESGERERWGVVLAHWVADDTASLIPLGTATGAMAMASAAKITTAAVGAAILVAGGWWWAWGSTPDPPQPERAALAPGAPSSPLDDPAGPVEPQVGEARQAVEPVEGRVAAAASSAPRAPLRGQLLDDAGGALPDYRVLVRDSEGRLALADSDEFGRLETAESFAAGSLLLRGIDHGDLMHDRDQDLTYYHRPDLESTRDAPGGEPEWTFRVGPTYTLDTELPAGTVAEDFDVELHPLGRNPVIGVGRAPLRPGGQPWVRFNAHVPYMNGEGPWALRVRSEDGYWSGQAIVETRVGVHHEPVALEISARGRLEGTCRTTEGPLLGQLTNLPLRPVDGAELEAADWEAIYLRGDGRFEGQHLPPGEYELFFRTQRHRRQTQRVLIEAGRTTTVELLVERRDDLASISGVVVSSAGPLPLDRARLMIRHSAVFGNFFVTHVETHGEGEFERGTFRFEDVPLGEYTLALVDEAKLALEPSELTVSAGDTDVRLRCRSVTEEERTRYVLIVRVSGSDEPLRYPRFGHRIAGSSTMFNGDADGRVDFSIAAGQAFEWMVGADGFVPRWGSELDFVGEEPLTVELDPGWGTEFYVYAGLEPLEGIELLLDGESVGVTDAGGHLRVVLAEKPERLSITSDEWVLAGGHVDAETGAMADGGFGTWVTLKRRE